MYGIAFDSLAVCKQLVEAGFSRAQAETLVELTVELEKARIAEREKYEAARKAEREKYEAMQKAEREKYEAMRKAEREKYEAMRKATEQDTLEAEHRNRLAVKADVPAARTDIEESVAGLMAAIKDMETHLLRWQIGIGLVHAVLLAKGFGWLDF